MTDWKRLKRRPKQGEVFSMFGHIFVIDRVEPTGDKLYVRGPSPKMIPVNDHVLSVDYSVVEPLETCGFGISLVLAKAKNRECKRP